MAHRLVTGLASELASEQVSELVSEPLVLELASQLPSEIFPTVCRAGQEANENLNRTTLKLREARSRLYRRRFLEVTTRWEAIYKIYVLCCTAQTSDIQQQIVHFLAISKMSKKLPFSI